MSTDRVLNSITLGEWAEDSIILRGSTYLLVRNRRAEPTSCVESRVSKRQACALLAAMSAPASGARNRPDGRSDYERARDLLFPA